MSRTMWITNKYTDLAYMLMCILTFFVLKLEGVIPALIINIFVWLSIVIMDSGHVYLSYIRAKKEFNILKSTIIIQHITFFIFFVAYQYLKLPYLWHFVVYATYFHFLRQFYGIYRWYLFKSKNVSSSHKLILNCFFWLLVILPVLCLHVRTNIGALGYYAKVDTFSYPSAELFKIFLMINIVTLFLWVLYEINFYFKSKELELSRVLYFFSTFVLFNLVFIFSSSTLQVVAPLVMAHGLQYYVLSGKMINQLHRLSVKKTVLLISLLGVVLGILSSLFEDEIDLSYDFIYTNYYDHINIFLVSILLTPLFFHYGLDMIIWTKKYLEKFDPANS